MPVPKLSIRISHRPTHRARTILPHRHRHTRQTTIPTPLSYTMARKTPTQCLPKTLHQQNKHRTKNTQILQRSHTTQLLRFSLWACTTQITQCSTIYNSIPRKRTHHTHHPKLRMARTQRRSRNMDSTPPHAQNTRMAHRFRNLF